MLPHLDEDARRMLLREKIKVYNEMKKDDNVFLFPDNHDRDIPVEPYPRKGIRDVLMSTLWFFEDLNVIAEKILYLERKEPTLVAEIKRINMMLPAYVQIPFAGKIPRSCVILHIPPSELKVFETKERAPYLLCIEIYDPEEEAKMPIDEEDSLSNHSSRTYSMATEPLANSADQSFESDENNPDRKFVFSKRLSSSQPFQKFISNGDTVSVVYDLGLASSNQESSQQQAKRIRSRSPFGDLKT